MTQYKGTRRCWGLQEDRRISKVSSRTRQFGSRKSLSVSYAAALFPQISILSPGSMACERGSPLPAASSPSSSPPRTQTSRLPASCFSWRRGFRRGEESSYAAPLLSDYAGGERHDLPSGAPLDRTKYDSLTISSSASSPRRDSHPSRPCCASSPSSCSCQPGALRTSGKSPRQLCATEGSFRNEDGTPSGGPSRRRFFRPSLPFCSPSASRGSLSSPPAERQECERGTGAALASSFSSVSLWAAVQLLREGRCMIVNSFSTFKFIACYSVLQFTSVLLLYAQAGNLTDSQVRLVFWPLRVRPGSKRRCLSTLSRLPSLLVLAWRYRTLDLYIDKPGILWRESRASGLAPFLFVAVTVCLLRWLDSVETEARQPFFCGWRILEEDTSRCSETSGARMVILLQS